MWEKRVNFQGLAVVDADEGRFGPDIFTANGLLWPHTPSPACGWAWRGAWVRGESVVCANLAHLLARREDNNALSHTTVRHCVPAAGAVSHHSTGTPPGFLHAFPPLSGHTPPPLPPLS